MTTTKSPVTETFTAPNGAQFPVQIRWRTNAWRLRARVDARKSRIVVTAPTKRSWITMDYIRGFIRDNAAEMALWHSQVSVDYSFRPGNSIPFFGVMTNLAVTDGDEMFHSNGTIYAPDDGNFAVNIRMFLYEKLQDYVYRMSDRYASQRNHYFSDCRVRSLDHMHAWGCCHHDTKKLSYDWRLVGASPDCIASICAHEVAHLKYNHHKPSFWREVYTMMPEKVYKQHEHNLKLTQNLGSGLIRLGLD